MKCIYLDLAHRLIIFLHVLKASEIFYCFTVRIFLQKHDIVWPENFIKSYPNTNPLLHPIKRVNLITLSNMNRNFYITLQVYVNFVWTNFVGVCTGNCYVLLDSSVSSFFQSFAFSVTLWANSYSNSEQYTLGLVSWSYTVCICMSTGFTKSARASQSWCKNPEGRFLCIKKIRVSRNIACPEHANNSPQWEYISYPFLLHYY